MTQENPARLRNLPGTMADTAVETMKTTPASMDEVLAKRAKLLDEKAERAEVRRVRALKLGNQREAEGAKRTVEEALDGARRLRAKIEECPSV